MIFHPIIRKSRVTRTTRKNTEDFQLLHRQAAKQICPPEISEEITAFGFCREETVQ